MPCICRQLAIARNREEKNPASIHYCLVIIVLRFFPKLISAKILLSKKEGEKGEGAFICVWEKMCVYMCVCLYECVCICVRTKDGIIEFLGRLEFLLFVYLFRRAQKKRKEAHWIVLIFKCEHYFHINTKYNEIYT